MPSANNQVRKAKVVLTKTAQNSEPGLLMHNVPEPPEHLSEDSALWWTYYCTVLFEGRCLKRTYLTSIHNLCIAHNLREGYMDAIERTGGVVITRERIVAGLSLGEECIVNPLVKSLQRLLIDMDKLLASLGMTAYTDKALEYDSSAGLLSFQDGPPSVSMLPPPENISA